MNASADNKKRNLALGCGCLLLIVLSCCCSTGIFFQQDQLSYEDPGVPIGEAPIYGSEPFRAEYIWYQGDAEVRMYVDLGASAAPGTRVTGTLSCAGPSFDVDEVLVPTDGVPAGWVWVNPGNPAPIPTDGPFGCGGTLNVDARRDVRALITVRQTRWQRLMYEL